MKNLNNVENRLNELNNQYILSIDAETNGLWGQAFAIAGVLYEPNGCEIDRFVGRCSINEEVNDWVRDNVLTQMTEIKETHKDYKSLLIDFFKFLNINKDLNYRTLVHMGHIVESKLLIDAHNMSVIGDWDAPYEWYDVCLFFGDSTDNYNKENNIEIEEMIGGTHNPLYDCISAYKAFKHFINK